MATAWTGEPRLCHLYLGEAVSVEAVSTGLLRHHGGRVSHLIHLLVADAALLRTLQLVALLGDVAFRERTTTVAIKVRSSLPLLGLNPDTDELLFAQFDRGQPLKAFD